MKVNEMFWVMRYGNEFIVCCGDYITGFRYSSIDFAELKIIELKNKIAEYGKAN